MKTSDSKIFFYCCTVNGFLGLAFSTILLFSFNKKSYAQNENLHFEHIGVEEGLLNERITAILQDSKGFLWFGTFDGLYKYDAYSFTKYQFDPFDSTSLSQNFIYTIFEDKYGTIWVSTFEGLCKFDRSTEKFTRYKPSPEEKFFNPNIIAINEGTDGMLWVASTSSELARFNRKTGKFLEDSFAFDLHDLHGISVIYKDDAGKLWIGSNAGLHMINSTPVKGGTHSNISITSYQYDPNNPNSLSGNIVRSVMEDRTGLMWIATNNGLTSFDKKSGRFKRYQHEPGNIHSISSNNLVVWFGNAIKEDRDGNLWIATDKGLNKFNPARTIFTSYFHTDNDAYSLSSDNIYGLLIDNAGILWAASWNAKLNKANLNRKAFRLSQFNPNNNNSLSDNQVTAIVEDSTGIVWIGTYGGGLNRWNKRTNEYIHFRNDPANPGTLRHDTITSMLEDKHGHLWIGNGDVLSQLNKHTSKFTHYPVPIANGVIFSITEDRQGILWLGTGNGIRSFDETTSKFDNYYVYDPKNPNGISDGTAQTIFADSKDNIWIGYGSMGSDRYDKKTKRFSHYKHDPHDPTSIPSNIVFSFYEDKKGNLWLGSWAGGLSYFDYKKESFKTFTNKHGLASTTVFSIVEDNTGHLWLGTRNGLSRFDPATNTFINYDYKDGLQGNIFAAGYRDRAAGCKGRDGTLYFGGNNGFNFFDPLCIKPNGQVTPLVITRFKLLDSLVKGANEKKEIVLEHSQNYFSFEFSSLSFYNPVKNKYAYKLEGIDNDWVYSGSRHYAAYTNVNPGTYTFKLKGTNNDGVWNENGTYITIIINPPWWHTWFAYASYVLVFFLALIIFIKWREKILKREKILLEEKVNLRTQELQKEKEKVESSLEHIKMLQTQLIETEKINERLRISQELHDDIGGTLSGIVLYSHLAENQIQSQHTDEVEQSLNIIQQSANNIVNKLSDIIWSVNPQHNSIKDLFQKLREYAIEMAAAKNIKVQINSPEHLAEFDLPLNIRHNIYLLFKEAINNAIKYSSASLLQLSVHHSDHNVEFAISDNGKGFDMTTVKTGNGLMNMQKRADYIKAKFYLRSIPKKGTVISLQCSIEASS